MDALYVSQIKLLVPQLDFGEPVCFDMYVSSALCEKKLIHLIPGKMNTTIHFNVS